MAAALPSVANEKKIRSREFHLPDYVIVAISEFKGTVAIHVREVERSSKKWTKTGVMLYKGEYEDLVKFGLANVPGSDYLTQPLINSSSSVQMKLRSEKLSFSVGAGALMIQADTQKGTKSISITMEQLESMDAQSVEISKAIKEVEEEIEKSAK